MNELRPIYILIFATILDTILGDPKYLPHPIVMYGKLISFFEKILNRGKFRTIKGAIMSLLLIALSFSIPYFLLKILTEYGYYKTEFFIASALLFFSIAAKTLINEGRAVFKVLKDDGINAGRKQLARIVGRDTSTLSNQQIKIAVLETMSENLSDGVIAPLFYFFILGVPGALAYKMVNTLDSMIGYRNKKFEKFGKFAAKTDDLFNFIPARITAILLLIVSLKIGNIRSVWRDAKKHLSPNAGYPESALANILNCQFGGDANYFGELHKKQTFGKDKREIVDRDIELVAKYNFLSMLLLLFVVVVFYALS